MYHILNVCVWTDFFLTQFVEMMQYTRFDSISWLFWAEVTWYPSRGYTQLLFGGVQSMLSTLTFLMHVSRGTWFGKWFEIFNFEYSLSQCPVCSYSVVIFKIVCEGKYLFTFLQPSKERTVERDTSCGSEIFTDFLSAFYHMAKSAKLSLK